MLRKANLAGANLTGSQLGGADFTAADLAGACLMNADLRNAIIDGANFTGANLTGARLEGLDPAKAKGLDLARTKKRKAGPLLRTLQQEINKDKSLHFSFEASLDLQQGHAQLSVRCSSAFTVCDYVHYGDNEVPTNVPWDEINIMHNGQHAGTVSACVLFLVERFPGGKLRPDSIKVTSGRKACRSQVAELESLVVAALHETLGLKVPSEPAEMEGPVPEVLARKARRSAKKTGG